MHQFIRLTDPKDLLDYLEGRTAPCRTSSVPHTAADLESPKDRAEAETNQATAQTTGFVTAAKTTGPFPPLGGSPKQYANVSDTISCDVQKTSLASKPPTVSAVVRVQTPEKPNVKVRTMGIGQVIRFRNGNAVYRIGPDNFLFLTPYNVTLHTKDTLLDFEGEVLPLGSTITIRV